MTQVIVMQGLSGSGKSTKAHALAATAEGAVVVSADDYFMVDGDYRFDPSKLSEAHGSCFRRFMAALQSGVELIVVDNTNTSAVEIAPYMLAAQAFGAEAKVLRVECDPEVAAARNTHGTPKHVVLAMAKRLNDPLPPWWTVEAA